MIFLINSNAHLFNSRSAGWLRDVSYCSFLTFRVHSLALNIRQKRRIRFTYEHVTHVEHLNNILKYLGEPRVLLAINQVPFKYPRPRPNTLYELKCRLTNSIFKKVFIYIPPSH
jgi:hypothetical protein